MRSLQTFYDLAFLIPSGSADEKINGISHLFEHIVISEFYKKGILRGHTTEDYMFFHCKGLEPNQVFNELKLNYLRQEKFETEKQLLIREINRNKFSEGERFFNVVWEDTIYENSPLGEAEAIKNISHEDIKNFKKEILKKPIFFYKKENQISILNNHSDSLNTTTDNKIIKKIIEFDERLYNVYYFKTNIEKLHLLKRILNLINPNKHIQLSEKKKMSALIIEMGIRFPSKLNISPLRIKALREIEDKLIEMKTNLYERLVNELKSIYFYKMNWPERINKLLKTSDYQLLKIIKQLDG